MKNLRFEDQFLLGPKFLRVIGHCVRDECPFLGDLLDDRLSLGLAREEINALRAEPSVVLTHVVVAGGQLKPIDSLLLAYEIFFGFVFANLEAQWHFQTLDQRWSARVVFDSALVVVVPPCCLHYEVTWTPSKLKTPRPLDAARGAAEVGTQQKL